MNRKEEVLEFLPATAREIGKALGISTNYASVLLTDLKKEGKIYICAYVRETIGLSTRTRAVYAEGKKRDAPRIARLTPAERQRAHRARKKPVNSIWALGGAQIFSTTRLD